MEKVELPGWDLGPVYFSEKIDSTNNYLKMLAGKGAPAGTVVWSREQTGGRGRRGRKWMSPRGGLYFSVLLHIQKGIKPSFSLVVGGSVIKALETRDVPGLKLKWPNDIFRGSKKVGGILCENLSGNLIVGIGLNLKPIKNLDFEEKFLPGNLGELQQYLPEEIIGLILRELKEDFQVYQEQGFRFFREKLQGRSFLLNRRVQVDNFSGEVMGYGEKGQLILKLPGGAFKEIWQGTVVLLEEG